MKSRFVLACGLVLSLSASSAVLAQEREEESGNDGPELLEQEDFWWTRVSYPTGEYDQRWVVR